MALIWVVVIFLATKSKPEETLMVGDHYTDLEAARRAGCRRALARYGFGDPREETFDFEVGSFPEFVMAVKGF